jgi:hypothetical protein
MATRKKTAAVAVADDDDDIEEAELEELDEDADDEDEAPTKAAAPEIWGVQSLILLIKEKTGKTYKPREVRTLLRKMAREDGTINREIVAGNKSRYAWSGPGDPEVRAVLKSVKGGAIESAKKAALDKLKADKAKKTAAASTTATKAKKKAAPPPDEDDDDDDE